MLDNSVDRFGESVCYVELEVLGEETVLCTLGHAMSQGLIQSSPDSATVVVALLMAIFVNSIRIRKPEADPSTLGAQELS